MEHQRDCAKSSEYHRILFVTNCFNEVDNIEELHRRTRHTFKTIQTTSASMRRASFGMIISDNCSTDGTSDKLIELASQDKEVLVLLNHQNYGPEASLVNALRYAKPADIVIAMSSDLQDPPEIATQMVSILERDLGIDAILCAKTGERPERDSLHILKRIYYKALGYSSRLKVVPSGFHGFGAYRYESIQEALQFWDCSKLNLRMCLTNGCCNPFILEYRQARRVRGESSYSGTAYINEALESLLLSDATASRLAFFLSVTSLTLAIGVSLAILINWLGGRSLYEPGIPTLMALVICSFSLQMLMIAVLSRQVEELRLSRHRPKIRHRAVSQQAGSAVR